MARPAGRCFQAAERRRMPATGAKRWAASRRRGGDALPEIAYHSTHRGLAILGDGHATARTSRRSCRGVFRNRFYPQILLKSLFPRHLHAPSAAGRIPPSDGDARGKSVWAGGLLEDQHVQGLVRNKLLQPRVLLLELLKLLGHLRIHPAELRPPREYVCWLIPSRRQDQARSHPSQGPHQPAEAGPRSALHCVASSSENPFQLLSRHEDSLTRPGSGFGEGVTPAR